MSDKSQATGSPGSMGNPVATTLGGAVNPTNTTPTSTVLGVPGSGAVASLTPSIVTKPASVATIVPVLGAAVGANSHRPGHGTAPSHAGRTPPPPVHFQRSRLSGHAAARDNTADRRSNMSTSRAISSTTGMASVSSTSSLPLNTSIKRQIAENHNNSNLANPSQATQVPVLALQGELVAIDPFVVDGISIPQPIDADTDVTAHYRSDLVFTDPDESIPKAVMETARFALMECHNKFESDYREDVEAYNAGSEVLRGENLGVSALLDLINSGHATCFRRSTDRRYYERTQFIIDEGQKTDLAQVSFHFRNMGSPLVNNTNVGVASVNASSTPFANIGPNKDPQLELEQIRAQAEARIFESYGRVHKIHSHTWLSASPQWSPSGGSTLAALVHDAVRNNRDFFHISMPFSAVGRLFGFDPNDVAQLNQKGHIAPLSVVIDSYDSTVFDKFPCHVSLAVNNTRGGTKELLRAPFSNEGVVPDSVMSKAWGRGRHERAFLPDSTNKVQKYEEGVYDSNRILFHLNRPKADVDKMDYIVGDYYPMVEEFFKVDPNDKGKVWIALPLRKSGKWERAQNPLTFFVLSNLAALIERAPSSSVVAAVRKKYPKLAKEYLKAFITDNGDEVKVPEVVKPKKAPKPSKKEKKTKSKKKNKKSDDEETSADDEQALASDVSSAEDVSGGEARSRSRSRSRSPPGRSRSSSTSSRSSQSDYDSEGVEEDVSDRERNAQSDDERSRRRKGEDTDKDEDTAQSATDIEAVKHEKKEEEAKTKADRAERVWESFASDWQSLGEDHYKLLSYMAKKSITKPNASKPTIPIIDPFTGKEMKLGVQLDAVKAKEYINGILNFIDVSHAYVQLQTVSLLFRPIGGIVAMNNQLEAISKASDAVQFGDWYKMVRVPFDPQIRLSWIFRQYKVVSHMS